FQLAELEDMAVETAAIIGEEDSDWNSARFAPLRHLRARHSDSNVVVGIERIPGIGDRVIVGRVHVFSRRSVRFSWETDRGRRCRESLRRRALAGWFVCAVSVIIGRRIGVDLRGGLATERSSD